MKSVFITSRGKVEIERSALYIKNLKPDFDSSIFGRLLFPTAALALSLIKFIEAEKPFDYFIAAVWGIMFLGYSNRFYEIIFKKSFANRIPLHRITSVEVKPDHLDLEVDVVLHLKNRRCRIIPFRKLEGQYESFIEEISTQIAQPQLA